MSAPRNHVLIISAVFFIALNLRPGATSIGPVLEEMASQLGMNATTVGVVGALPGLTFAVVGAMAVTLARKLGLVGTLIVGLVAISTGLLARSLVSSVPLFLVFTVLAFAGMAVGNVLVPPFIRRTFPFHVPQMTTVYTVGLAIGSMVPALVAAPIAGVAGWRVSLALWGGTALIALLLWLRVRAQATPADHVQVTKQEHPVGVAQLLRSRRAVALAVFFGMQSAQAYVQFAWVAQILRDGGVSPAAAGALVSLIAAFGIPGGLIIPGFLARGKHLSVLVVGLAGLLAAGYVGMWLAPATIPVVWSICLGLSGMCFPLAISLITARSRAPEVTAALSAFTQSVGYLFAALGPFAVGLLFDVAGSWDVPLAVLTASSVVLALAGLVSVRPGDVDSELGR